MERVRTQRDLMDGRYLVAFGAFLTQFVVVGLWFSVGLFFNVFEDEFGWSRSLLSGSSSLAVLLMGFLAFFAGRFSDRFGPTVVLGITGVVYGAGYALISVVGEPWHLVVVITVFFGLGLSTHDVVTLSTIARWFRARRGTMTGLVKVGTASGQMVLPPLVALMMTGYGWRTAVLVLGVAAVALLLIAALSMKRPPPSRSPADQHNEVSGPKFSEVRRDRAFWTLCAAQFLFFPSLFTIPLHIAVHGMDLGMTPTTAATLLTMIGGTSVVGRLTIGTSIDRIGARNAYALCLAPLMCGLLVLLAADSHWLLYVAVTVYGFGHGGLFTVVSPAVAELFGTRAHGAIFGGILFFGTFGAAIGPIAAGWLFDTTGSYALGFTGLAVMAAIALALALTLPKRRGGSLAVS